MSYFLFKESAVFHAPVVWDIEWKAFVVFVFYCFIEFFITKSAGCYFSRNEEIVANVIKNRSVELPIWRTMYWKHWKIEENVGSVNISVWNVIADWRLQSTWLTTQWGSTSRALYLNLIAKPNVLGVQNAKKNFKVK